ncbi:MAG: hypothetical protein JNK82_13095 [Myxococcaceae bacterium]|nr:hypothetical protein [Myxococcaceae bacterium]
MRPPDADFERIELTLCDGGDACSLVADGTSRVTVRACVAEQVQDPLADVTLKLTLSAGTFVGPSEGSIAAQRCLDAVFTAPSSTQAVRIDAALADFRQSLDVALAPAPLGPIELTPAPAAIAPGATNDLRVRVRATQGTPTAGTRVAARIAAQTPATPGVEIWPASTLANADGTATFSVYAGLGVTSVTYEVTATPPGGAAVSTTLVVPAR